MKVIIANGPPRSGKDTMCGLLLKNLKGVDLIPLCYKRVLYVGVAKRYNLSVEAVYQMNADTNVKDEPSDLFDGFSVRQALQFESEVAIKKIHGPDGVAIQTFKLLEEEYGVERLKNAVLYSAGAGFNSELYAMYDHFDMSVEDVFIIRMLREGCSFEGDTREFLLHPDMIIQNNGDIEHLESYIPRVQGFCEGSITSVSRLAHMQRFAAREMRKVWIGIREEIGKKLNKKAKSKKGK